MYTIIDGYGKTREAVKIDCDNCGKEFLKAKRFMGKSKRNFCSPRCLNESHKKERVFVNCFYCGKEKKITEYRFKITKTKKFFCNKKHQQLAQFSHNGIDYHCNYKDGLSSYRDVAFRAFSHKCELCSYEEDLRILEVHHIDHNRSNNKPENLMILCPNCHAKITHGFYILIDRLLSEITE